MWHIVLLIPLISAHPGRVSKEAEHAAVLITLEDAHFRNGNVTEATKTLDRSFAITIPPTEEMEIRRYEYKQLIKNGYKNVDTMFDDLCLRGVQTIPLKIESTLNCFLRNMPFEYSNIKIEQVYMNPSIVRYHDAISDCEIKLLISDSKAQLVRNTRDHVRKSNLWLREDGNRNILKVHERIKRIVASKYDPIDLFIVTNQGLTGSHGSHFDSTNEDTEIPQQKSLITVLGYLNDVANGGQTAFPYLGLVLEPIKGSFVVWYNIHSETTRIDPRLKHGPCVVVRGTKWTLAQPFDIFV